VIVREGSRITRFVEKPEPGSLPGQDTVNAGTYVLEPEAIARFPQGRLSFEREVFPGLLEQGAHLEGWVGEGVWADLGTPERFLAGHRLALDGRLEWPSLEEVEQVAPGRWQHPSADVDPGARIRGPVLLAAGTQVGQGATVGPYAVLGEGTHVGEGAMVTDSVVFDHVRLAGGAQANGALIGHHACLGCEALVEPGTVVGDECHVPAGTRLAAGTRYPEDA
jgi:NDP-sugar pyrophosphorylase family protein